MVVVVEVESMDEARHGHILLLHSRGNGILYCLCLKQAVHRGLVVHLYPGGVRGSHVGFRLLASYGSPVRATLRSLFLLALRGLRVLSVLLLGICQLVVLLRLLGKFPRLDFLVGHLNVAVEAHAVAMGKEEMDAIVSVPVLR